MAFQGWRGPANWDRVARPDLLRYQRRRREFLMIHCYIDWEEQDGEKGTDPLDDFQVQT